MPAVSVVMPAYNAGLYIGEAIDSIVAQGHDDLEVVVVDDGSTDDTVAIATGRHPSVHVFRQSNQGSAVARNFAIARARGANIAFLDADDAWRPGKLAAQLAVLEGDRQWGGAYCAWDVWHPDAQGRYLRPAEDSGADPTALDPAGSGWLYHQLLLTSVILTSSLVLRR